MATTAVRTVTWAVVYLYTGVCYFVYNIPVKKALRKFLSIISFE